MDLRGYYSRGGRKSPQNFADGPFCRGKNKTPKPFYFEVFVGGRYRTRTCDPLHVKQVLIPAELTVRHSENYNITGGMECQAFFLRFSKIFLEQEKGRGEGQNGPQNCQLDIFVAPKYPLPRQQGISGRLVKVLTKRGAPCRKWEFSVCEMQIYGEKVGDIARTVLLLQTEK